MQKRRYMLALYIILALLVINAILSFAFNYFVWFNRVRRQGDLLKAWCAYDRAILYADEAILDALKMSLVACQYLKAFVFLWPYWPDLHLRMREDDRDLLRQLKNNVQSGDIFLDDLNRNYASRHEAIRAYLSEGGDKIRWHFCGQYGSTANFFGAWFFCNPVTQWLFVTQPWAFLRKLYFFMKISSNHQKILSLNHGESLWMGSRNFNRKNWANQDHMLHMTGDFSRYVIRRLSYLNAGLNPLHRQQFLADLPNRVDLHDLKDESALVDTRHHAKLLINGEIKHHLFSLIRRATHIDVMMNLFSDITIIRALNAFVERGGKLRVLLDSNAYIFTFRFPYMPNVVAMRALCAKAEVKVLKTDFQMHTKSAVFVLDSGARVTWVGSVNWTVGGLSRLCFNDSACLLLNDERCEAAFYQNFDALWSRAKDRSSLVIPYAACRYYFALILGAIGFVPW